jgi:CRP/FNR family transcriptional regulator, cyclic AMP receptor protein
MSQTSTSKDDLRSCCVVTGMLAESWPPDDEQVSVRRVAPGEPACAAGDTPDSVYYVRRGLVKVVRYSESGGEVVIDYYPEGTLYGGLWFCQWPVCEEDMAREVALAVKDSEIIVMAFARFKKHISARPEALLGLLADYCRRLATARNRIESLVLYQAEERLARALLLLAAQHSDTNEVVHLRPAVTHEELAHLIGVSRPLVTKLLGGLRDRGLIESPSAGNIIVHRQRIATAFQRCVN